MPTKTALVAALLVAQLLNINAAAQVKPAAAQVRLTDVTEAAGVTFRHVASPEKSYIVESMSGGVALFDYDHDGWLDIYFVNSLTVDLRQVGRQDTQRSLPQQRRRHVHGRDGKAGVADIGWGMGAAVGDYDNDG